jgi:hypothetical protein
MQSWVVVFVEFYGHLANETLDVLNVRIIFSFSVNLVASNDHQELVDLKTKSLSYLVPHVA